MMLRVCLWAALFPLIGQIPADPPVDAAARSAAIEQLIVRLDAGYVVPAGAQAAIARVREAQRAGAYDQLGTAKAFATQLTADLQAASHDKHLAVFVDPEPVGIHKMQGSPKVAPPPRDRFNYGFYKVERLLGNVGYLEIRSFANLDEARQTAAAYLDALANFDSIVLDLRQNGGGNTPMAAFVASSTHQDIFILVGPSTFSAAEDFSYAMQQLKRATLVGETTGGGAHMGRGLQRLSPLFTAFIPTGQSVNPITKTNWEDTGVTPDVSVPAPRALIEAHLAALRRLLEREQDATWKATLQRALETVTAQSKGGR
jgi:C-terminal processing protease CtpA/Prc